MAKRSKPEASRDQREASAPDFADERPGAVDGDMFDLGPESAPGTLVHHDHRIVINYNASTQAAQHRALTRAAAERQRTGTF